MKGISTLLKAVYPPFVCFLSSLLILFVFHFYENKPASFLFLGIALIFLLDVKGRVNDYVFLKDKSDDFFCDRVLDKYAKSWCGRTVVLGVYPEARSFFYSRGYRWFHLLPDRVLSTASPFLRFNFWKNLFSGHRR